MALLLLLNLVLLSSAIEMEESKPEEPKPEDNQLLDHFYSIWRTTGLYPHDGGLHIYNMETELCLSTHPGFYKVFGGQIVGLPCRKSPEQLFYLLRIAEGHFVIHKNFIYTPQWCLNNGLSNNTSALLGSWCNSPSHQYRFTFPTANQSSFHLVNRGAGNCLTAGTFISCSECSDEDGRQLWQLYNPQNSRYWPRDIAAEAPKNATSM